MDYFWKENETIKYQWTVKSEQAGASNFKHQTRNKKATPTRNKNCSACNIERKTTEDEQTTKRWNRDQMRI